MRHWIQTRQHPCTSNAFLHKELRSLGKEGKIQREKGSGKQSKNIELKEEKNVFTVGLESPNKFENKVKKYGAAKPGPHLYVSELMHRMDKIMTWQQIYEEYEKDKEAVEATRLKSRTFLRQTILP